MNDKIDVVFDVDDGIAVVTINRPAVRNALRYATLRGLEDAISKIVWDDAIRAGVIVGAGGLAFSAGVDLKDIQHADPDQAVAERYMMSGQLTCAAIWNCSKPIVAAIEGYALGGGLELALSCHQRVGASNCTLGFPEIKLQHLPAWGGMRRLATLARMHTLLMMSLNGEFIDGRRAFEEGMIDESVEPGQALEAAKELARKLSVGKPNIVARGLEIFRRVYDFEDPSISAMERWAAGMDFDTDEHRRKIDDFASKHAS